MELRTERVSLISAIFFESNKRSEEKTRSVLMGWVRQCKALFLKFLLCVFVRHQTWLCCHDRYHAHAQLAFLSGPRLSVVVSAFFFSLLSSAAVHQIAGQSSLRVVAEQPFHFDTENATSESEAHHRHDKHNTVKRCGDEDGERKEITKEWLCTSRAPPLPWRAQQEERQTSTSQSPFNLQQTLLFLSFFFPISRPQLLWWVLECLMPYTPLSV